MRKIMMLGGLALALVGKVAAVEVGQPGTTCMGQDCAPTSSFEPQPVATVPMAGAASVTFTPPTPMVTAPSVTQAVPVMAHDMGSMSMGGDTQAPSTKALIEANAKMHAGMSGPFTGDADVDFVKGMIAHHQGAIDMAKAELAYGKDPDIKMLANDIIKAQGKEIDMMTNWLALHGPKPAAAAKTAKPRPPVMKAKAKPIGQLLEDTKAAPEPEVIASKPVEAAPAAKSGAVSGTIGSTEMGGNMPMPLLDGMPPATPAK
jgi:hypothetical protein